MRPDKHARAMMSAELESVWSTCLRKSVGTVATDADGSILSTGRNGSPIGLEHCKDINTRNDLRCPFCIHSEKNLINHAARNGVSLRGANVYTLYRPCESCAKDLVQACIGSLYYRWDYDSDNENLHPDILNKYNSARNYVISMFNKSYIHIEQLNMTKEEAEFSEWLEIWSKSM